MTRAMNRDRRSFGSRGTVKDLGSLLAPWAAMCVVAGLGLNSAVLAGGQPSSSSGIACAAGNDGGPICCPPPGGAPGGGGGGGLGMAVPSNEPAGPTTPNPEPGTDGPAMSGQGPKGSELLSDPIDFATGDFKTSCVDLTIPGRGFDFEFRRTYAGNDSLWFEYSFPQLTDAAEAALVLDSGEPIPVERSCIAPMGAQWWHSYSMLVYTWAAPGATAGYPNLIRDGRITSFTDVVTSGSVWSQPETAGVMEYTAGPGVNDDEFVYRTADGGIYTFEEFDFDEADGELGNASTGMTWFRVTLIEDRNGNDMVIAYKGDTFRIDHILDTLDNQITFEYQDAGNAYLLTAIVDESGGRRIDYTYKSVDLCLACENDANGTGPGGTSGDQLSTGQGGQRVSFIDPILTNIIDPDPVPKAYVLETVTTPVVGHDSNSDVYDRMPSDGEHDNRYTNGRVWEYEYEYLGLAVANDSNSEFECDAIRLKTITDPAETVLVSNLYDAQPGNTGALRGRPFVKEQTTPSGTYKYQYDFDDPDGDVSTEDYKVTIRTKRGQLIELGYERRGTVRDDSCCSLYCFDGDNVASGYGRLSNFLIYRNHLTGFEDPANPFTIQGGSKLRAGDPSSFGTEYERDDRWQITKLTTTTSGTDSDTVDNEYGYSKLIADGGLAADELERAMKKLAVTKRTRGGTGATPIVEEWRYNFDFSAGCCGASYPTAYIDGRDFLSLYRYEAGTGNLLGIYRGITPGGGLSLDTVVDSGNVATVRLAALSFDEFTYNSKGQIEYHDHPEKVEVGGTSTRRRDKYAYGDSSGTASYGRLVSVTVDDGGKNLISSFEYDEVGNVIKVIQPSEDYKTLVWNQANQIVREQWWEVVPGTPSATTLLSWREYFYDSRGNPVRIDTVAFDTPNATATRTSEDWAITLLAYDFENNLIRTATREAVASSVEGTSLPQANANGGYPITPGVSASGWDPSDWVITEYQYDANKNLQVVRKPEAVAGNQPDNGTVTLYDERDLPYRRFAGIADTANAFIPAASGDPDNDPLPIVTQTDYDWKGRPVASKMLDPLTGTASRIQSTAYDVFDRVVSIVDPMGNETQFDYDTNSNVTETRSYGELIDDVTSANQLLAITRSTYDGLNRTTLREEAVFDLASPPANSGAVTSWQWIATDYNKDSSVAAMRAPAGPSPSATPAPSGSSGLATTTYRYDSASRIALITMPDTSDVAYGYDANSNVITQTERDWSALDSAFETYVTTHDFDGLDRRTQTVQGVYSSGNGPENEFLMAYDSRSNMIESTDPRGNVTEYFFDGLSRQVTTQIDGAGMDIETLTGFDKSSRMITLTDDNTNSTNYTFDSLGREIKRTYADGTFHTTVYDEWGNPETVTDARGVVTTNLYDLNDRLIGREFDRSNATFVGGSDIGTNDVSNSANWDEYYEYDGLGRVVTANNEFSRVSRAHDSRGLLLTETTNADMANAFPDGQGGGADSRRTVTNTYDIAGNLTACAYPGGRDVRRSYDIMNRVIGIWDDLDPGTADIAGYDYLGPGRVHERRTGAASVNGSGVVRTGYEYAGFSGAASITGDYGFRQVREIRHELSAGGAPLEGRGFTWDAAGNKTSHNDLRTSYTGYRERTLSYDAANRLTVSETVFPSTSANDGTVTYALDGVHNRTAVSLVGNNTSGAPVGTYDSSQGDNAALNQYSVTPRLDGGTFNFEHGYDFNGNLMLIVEHPRTADMDGDYDLDGSDVSSFTAAFQNNESSADLNDDDIFDQADLSAFTGAFSGGPAGGFYNASFTYDQRNQLVGFRAVRGSSPVPIKESSYRYDCFNRRVATIIESSDSDPSTPDGRTAFFVYAGQASWQLIEEYASGDDMTADRSYIYGLYIDEVLSMRDQVGDDYYYHQDDLFSVYALTDDTGVVVERYAYGDYGQVSVTAEDGTPRTESAYGNTHTFTGRILCGELAMDDGGQALEYRNRYMMASTGSFIQKDPLGYFDGMNVYVYVIANPGRYLDPAGLCSKPAGPNLIPGCPPTKPSDSVLNDGWCYDSAGIGHCELKCYRSYGTGTKGGQQCCYNDDGTLNTDPACMGTIDLYGTAVKEKKDGSCKSGAVRLIRHFYDDFLPYKILGPFLYDLIQECMRDRLIPSGTPGYGVTDEDLEGWYQGCLEDVLQGRYPQ